MVIPPKLRSELAESLLYLDGAPFSFANYPCYREIYDGDHRGLLLKCGRQVAKTVQLSAPVSLANGFRVTMGDLRIGDVVLSLDTTTQQLVPKKVTWVSPTYKKPCRRVTTRQGHVLDIATTHPVRTWESWTTTATLNIGTRVAAIRQGGVFTNLARPSKARIELTACLIGEGYLSKKDVSFTQLDNELLTVFLTRLKEIHATHHVSTRAGTHAKAYRLHRNAAIHTWLREDGLMDCRSADFFVPRWVFDLSRKDTALFLNRLWSVDGACVQATRSKFDLEYSSTSGQLARDVQALLWKFGVPTSIRKTQPKIYQEKHPDRFAYRVRVETQEGVRRFLTEIGALGKSKKITLPTTRSNDNRDTYPHEINELLRQIIATRGNAKRFGPGRKASLRSAKLHVTLGYPPTHGKLWKYIKHFRADSRYASHLVDTLEMHVNGGVYWDRVRVLEDLGIQPCRDICVEDTHNFCVDGVVTHNSTTLCNFTIAESIGIPHFRTLYVSPSQEQTQTFSNTRLGKVVHYSPLVRQFFSTREFTSRTMLRMFRNGSEVKLTYASDDPDRARGNTADRANFDEVQDMIYDAVIPVINECMANSKYGYETYTGTPKTMENTIQHLWDISTQNEWIMQCEGCQKYNYIDGVASLGKTGPVCLKCGKLLNPRRGQWYSFKPESTLHGFHISQPMMPENCENPQRWVRILEKMERYSETKFKNEVLGVSDALGSRLISKAELEALCGDYDIYRHPAPGAQRFGHVSAGVDWSGGGLEGVSRTVLWIYGVTPQGLLHTQYFRIYPVTNPVSIIDDIAEVIKAYNVQMVAGDRGEGHLANNLLQQKLGGVPVVQIQYGAHPSAFMRNDAGGFYSADRTTVMDNFFMVLKRRGVVYPRLDYMTEVFNDTLNIYEEVTQMGKKVWRHSPTKPDDSFHAQVFAWLAAKILLMDLTFRG